MNTNSDTLAPVLKMAHGRTIGGEPAFTFPVILDVLALCTRNEVAVLGVELFKTVASGYSTEAMSEYELQLAERSWPEFVLLNNQAAADFVNQHPGGDDHFYLLTASLQGEFPGLVA
jgi:hypothetical protein